MENDGIEKTALRDKFLKKENFNFNRLNMQSTAANFSVLCELNEMSPNSLTLFSLPREILDKIFGYFSFEQLSKFRLVCKQFELISSSLLNSAFQRLQLIMLQKFQAIKSQMPRRESARRKHPSAREYDVIETLHMRLTLLQMAFGKHIERNHCCFFAGEILDEVHRILRYMKTTPNLARAYKVTDELFDLSTMAMEYFKEQIEPSLPEIKYFGSEFLKSIPSSRSSRSWKLLESPGTSTSLCCAEFNDEISDSSESDIKINKKLNHVQQVMKRHARRHDKLVRDMKKSRSRQTAQENQLKELSNRLDECNKKAEESSSKFNAILQEVNKCKTELQYWRSKSPANQICAVCSETMAPREASDAADGTNQIATDEANFIDFVPISAPESTAATKINFNLDSNNDTPSEIPPPKRRKTEKW